MKSIISRWFMFGLLLGWSLTHATVFGQTGKTTEDAKPTPTGKIRAGLDKNITIDFTGQSLTDVLNHFRDKVGVPINIDPMVVAMGGFNPMGGFIPGGDPMGGQVTIKGTNEKASTILRRTLNSQRLSFVVLEDGVLITSEDAAIQQQMRQRVSVDLSDVPIKKAVRDLARNHGVNLVIDPKVATEANASVSVQLDDTTLETALRVVAELGDLKAVRLGNVVFVTTEAKAKKIREEEKQIGTPNPMQQFFPPAVVGGGFGGFGGAIALPARAIPNVGAPPVPMNPGVQVDPAPPVPVKPVAPPKAGGAAPGFPPPPPPPAVQRPDQPVQPPLPGGVRP